MSEIRSGGIQGILPVPVQVLDKPRTAKFGHWREMTFYASAQYRGIHLWLTYFGSPGADGVQREDWVGELEECSFSVTYWPGKGWSSWGSTKTFEQAFEAQLRSTLEGAKNRRTKALKQLVDLDEAIVEMERSAAVHKIVQRVQGGIPQRAQEE
jgi:hypothetical protein